jgi:predicted amidohydrolase
VSLRVASCAYPIERLESFAQFRAKQAHWVQQAVDQGAQLLVFPEYASMELGSLFGTRGDAELGAELQALQALLPEYLALYRELSRRFGVQVLSPSFPERIQGGAYRNRARLHDPSGADGVVEKQMMTRFERELWGIEAGTVGPVFETERGLLGVAICYDSEFPLLVRRQVELGAEVVLVPSCTDTLAGYHRVQLSCRARALENQCFVVQAVTVGEAPWSAAVDQNRGAAGVFAPVDRGFPDDGVVALGELDRPGWVFADLELTRLAEVRADGQVRNHRDWSDAAHLRGHGDERVRLP